VNAAVIADTHGRALPEACLERLRAADLILHAGDIKTAHALEELTRVGPPVVVVAGNVDDPGLGLPERRVVEAAGARVGLIHAAGARTRRLERLRAAFPDCDAVVFGHSHIPLHERDERGFQIFNPGSPTDRRRQPSHTMGLADIGEGAIRFELVTL
jgi:putative phosphoesterase